MLRTQDKRLFTGRRLESVIPRYISPQLVSYPAATASSTGLTASIAHASANTKASSYTSLVDAADFDCDGFWLVNTSAGASVDTLTDIAFGAAASEVIVVANVHLASGSDSNCGGRMYIPIPVRAGTRISARTQGSTGGVGISLGIQLVRSGGSLYKRLSRCTTYGANTTDSGGVGIDPGGAAHTKSGWQEVTAATTAPAKALWVTMGYRANGVIGGVQLHMIDIGIGAGGSEAVLVNDLASRANSSADYPVPSWFGLFPVDIAAGTRIAARAQSSTTDATDRLIDVVVYAFD